MMGGVAMNRIVCVLMVFFLSVTGFGYLTLRHVAISGEKLEQVSQLYLIPTSMLLDWNPKIRTGQLVQGQVVLLPFPKGYIYEVGAGDSLSTIAQYFFTDVPSIASANQLSPPYPIRIGQKLFIPLSSIGKAFHVENNRYLWPTFGVISSEYGWRTHPITQQRSFHAGTDIAAPEGAPIFAAGSGLVTFVGENGGYGLTIDIDGDRHMFRYAHLSQISVLQGQRVQQGELIGRIGSTGQSTGPHLHFEIRTLSSRETLNPVDFLPPISKMYVLKQSNPLSMGGN